MARTSHVQVRRRETERKDGNSSARRGRREVWAAGDALVLDGRTLHRGLGNDSLGASIPMLVPRGIGG